MTRTEFTPGPWHLVRPAGVRSATAAICKVFFFRPKKDAECQANARLITAAPDLYEELVEAVNIIRVFHGELGWEIYEQKSPEMQRIKAALAKVETE